MDDDLPPTRQELRARRAAAKVRYNNYVLEQVNHLLASEPPMMIPAPLPFVEVTGGRYRNMRYRHNPYAQGPISRARRAPPLVLNPAWVRWEHLISNLLEGDYPVPSE